MNRVFLAISNLYPPCIRPSPVIISPTGALGLLLFSSHKAKTGRYEKQDGRALRSKTALLPNERTAPPLRGPWIEIPSVLFVRFLSPFLFLLFLARIHSSIYSIGHSRRPEGCGPVLTGRHPTSYSICCALLSLGSGYFQVPLGLTFPGFLYSSQ